MPGVAVVTGAGRGFGREIARGLAGRGYTVLATDVDAEAAAATADEVGGFSMQLDVRDPEAHRAAARAAAERGPLEVWVNNAGVMRTVKAWEHSDDEVRLHVRREPDGRDLGLARRGRGDARRPGARTGTSSTSRRCRRSAPVPGLAVYAATKHAVLGFTGSLQGDLDWTPASRSRCTRVCPDGADTQLLREQRHEPEAAIIWSGPRLLTAEEVAEHAVALLDSKKLVLRDPALARLGRAGDGDARAPGPRDRRPAAQAGRAPPCESDERRKHMTETTTVPSTGSNGAATARHDRGGEPVDREGDRERSGRGARAGGRAGRARSSRPARLGGAWLRRPRGRPEALPEVGLGQLRSA